MKKVEVELEGEDSQDLVEGVDFYYEGGLLVLTKNYLLKRGRCCANGCRNCPYPKENPNRLKEKSF